jgi:invasion protein IalB
LWEATASGDGVKAFGPANASPSMRLVVVAACGEGPALPGRDGKGLNDGRKRPIVIPPILKDCHFLFDKTGMWRTVQSMSKINRTIAIFAGLFSLSLVATGSSLAQRAQAKPAAAAGVQATLLQSFGDWGAYATDTSAGRICYAMSQPKQRKTKGKGLDPAYFFITAKRKTGVRNEVSVILGFSTKKGGEGAAEIDNEEKFGLLTQETKAWIKNPAEEPKFIAALRKGAKLEVKTNSALGNEVADTYSLKGFADALERAVKECR